MPSQAQLIGEEPRFALCRQLLTLYSQIGIVYTPASGIRQMKLQGKYSTGKFLGVELADEIGKTTYGRKFIYFLERGKAQRIDSR